jgi:hypothetical protein
MSPRTVKYVQAMVREGFDYNEWLKQVREQDARAKQVQPATTAHDVVAARVDNPINTPDGEARPTGIALIKKLALDSRALRRSHQEARTPNARLARWLEKVHRASGEFQGSRRRDAVYEYLAAVFAIVTHYKVRRRTTRLLRHAFEFANLPFDRDADAFSALIRCTCGNAVDSKTISKWSRALRYVAFCKKSDTDLKKFMKRAGGINSCAAQYVQRKG